MVEKVKDEYYCTNLEEKEYIVSNGIKYSFVKTIIEGKKIVTVWKFKKTDNLFKTLLKYYN